MKHCVSNHRKNEKNSILWAMVSGAFVFVVYFFIFSSYSIEQRLKTALGQAIFVMIMTFLSVTMMEFFFKLPKNHKMKYLSSVLFTGVIALALMTLVHIYLKTPQLVKTLVFSSASGLPSLLLFPLKLVTDHKKEVRLKENI